MNHRTNIFAVYFNRLKKFTNFLDQKFFELILQKSNCFFK